MSYPIVDNYRIYVERLGFGEWEWKVEYKDSNGWWKCYMSGKKVTLRRSIKRARNSIPVQVIQSQ